MTTSTERRAALKDVFTEARGCTRCPELARTRRQVVFGAGHADADLMFVGEAPGAREDEQGLPFVGAAGKLLDELLGDVGFARGDVFVANVLKCLRYDAMVQLGDGSWERIGRLVRARYSGTVMSVTPDGELVSSRVVGWHATPLGPRRVFELTFRSAKRVGRAAVNVHLTGDHPVLTERGYVRAAQLRPDDRVATGQGVSELAFDVLCGTLLGDGSISAAQAAWTCSHSAAQHRYATWLAWLLSELETTAAKVAVRMLAANGQPLPDTTQVRTLAHRALGILRSEFYSDRKVVPPWLGTQLNARMLAFWFMDDGHMRIRDGRQPVAEIAAHAFSDDDRQVLLNGLMRLGLPAKAARGRLYFDVPTSRRLSAMIAPYVHPSMRYKLHPDVAAKIPWRLNGFDRGKRRVLFDNVVVEDVTDRPRNDTTFFCIDVEETHNFVTSGGVVHNCRPPGNRDPLPSEIDSCQDYLMRQVELIRPRVICTLGNFATKLLRGEPTGITRLHGQAEIRVIGRRAVRLYPLFHPAAALYTRSLLDTLRADFAGLPALLALEPPEQPEAEPEAEAEPAVPEPAASEARSPEAPREPQAPPAAEEDLRAEDLRERTEPPPEAQLGLF